MGLALGDRRGHALLCIVVALALPTAAAADGGHAGHGSPAPPPPVAPERSHDGHGSPAPPAPVARERSHDGHEGDGVRAQAAPPDRPRALVLGGFVGVNAAVLAVAAAVQRRDRRLRAARLAAAAARGAG